MPVQPNTVCAHCGIPVYRTPKRIAAGEIICCSTACKAELMKGERVERVETHCLNCGVLLRQSPKRALQRQYCSHSCYLHHVKRDAQVCPVCEKEFVPDEVGIVYCSKKCGAAPRRKRAIVECHQCGKSIERPVSQFKTVNHKTGRIFCSRQCRYAYMLVSKSINGLEADFLAAFPMLKFTGDGRFPVNDAKGVMFPDFVLPYTNKIIEVWGDYWHEGELPQDRIDRLASCGYQTLVVWESEFRSSIDKVRVRVLAFLEMQGT